MIEAVERELAEAGCEALLIVAGSARDPDAAPFLGPAHVHTCLVVVRRGEAPLLGYTTPMEAEEAAGTGLGLITPEELDVARWIREAAREEEMLAGIVGQALLRAGVPPGRIALAGHLAAGAVHAAASALEADGFRFVSGHEIVRRLRKTKDERALAEIRRAAAGTVAAFRRVAEVLAAAEIGKGRLVVEGESLSVGSLRREIATVLATHGLEQPEGNIVAPGEQGATPHTAGDDGRLLRAGESLVVDLYPRGTLFADCTRTFCVGEPPEALRRAHATVREALARARQATRPGAVGWDLQEATCRFFEERGYATSMSTPGTTVGYVHGLGHGVGFELHEYPSFRRRPGSEGIVAAGDVLTLEPGLYDREAGYGVRIEDLVVVGADGSLENLTPLPEALDPRAW